MKREMKEAIEHKLLVYGEKGTTGNKSWDESILAVLIDTNGDPKQKSITLKYFEKKENKTAMEEIPVSAAAYIAWQKEMFEAIALQAVYRRLIKP